MTEGLKQQKNTAPGIAPGQQCQLHTKWWSNGGSNSRPPACKAGALPTELLPRVMVGVGGLEPPTSILSGSRSNQLSYTPKTPALQCQNDACQAFERTPKLPRKEVIQPHLPVRLPCYDFVPVATPALGRCLPEGLAHGLQALATPMT
jgi:hypothetical protein